MGILTWPLTNRILELFDLTDRKVQPGPTDPDVVICYDEFGPLNLQPHPGRHWAERDAEGRASPRARCRRATYVRPTACAISSPATTSRPTSSTAR